MIYRFWIYACSKLVKSLAQPQQLQRYCLTHTVFYDPVLLRYCPKTENGSLAILWIALLYMAIHFVHNRNFGNNTLLIYLNALYFGLSESLRMLRLAYLLLASEVAPTLNNFIMQ